MLWTFKKKIFGTAKHHDTHRRLLPSLEHRPYIISPYLHTSPHISLYLRARLLAPAAVEHADLGEG